MKTTLSILFLILGTLCLMLSIWAKTTNEERLWATQIAGACFIASIAINTLPMQKAEMSDVELLLLVIMVLIIFRQRD